MFGGLKLGFGEQEKNVHSFSENFLPPCSFCISSCLAIFWQLQLLQGITVTAANITVARSQWRRQVINWSYLSEIVSPGNQYELCETNVMLSLQETMLNSQSWLKKKWLMEDFFIRKCYVRLEMACWNISLWLHHWKHFKTIWFQYTVFHFDQPSIQLK